MPLDGGVPADPGRYRRARGVGGGGGGARGRGGEGKGYTSERIVDSEAAGWPGTEPRDWIPEMRQTDGTPEPSSPLAPPCPPDGGG